MIEYVVVLLSGLLVGFIGGYAGIGGAPFLIFALGAVLGYPQHMAQGTVIAIMLGPMSLPGVWVMRDRVRPLLRMIAIGVVTYACFSYAGAAVAYLFSTESLRLLFSILLLALGIRYLAVRENRPDRSRIATREPGNVHLNTRTMLFLGAAVGVVGGLFGIGAGVLLVPLLIKLFKVDKDDARALSLAILVPPVSIGAVLKYQMHGDIRWAATAIGFSSYLLSNYWGAKVGRTHDRRRFHFFMGIILIAIGILYASGVGQDR